MKNKKRGITVAMAVTMVVIIALLATTVTISVNVTLKGSKLKAFATELSTVQNTLYSYKKTTSDMNYISKDISVVPPNDMLTTQFSGENVIDGKILLHVIDLKELGIEKSIYGKEKTENDVYAVSFETDKVYYVKGYETADEIYYTLTAELEELLAGESGQEVVTENIVFEPSIVGWSKEAIKVIVKVPTTIDISTVNITTTISDIVISAPVLKSGYNEITINTENYLGNYIVSANYILNGQTKSQIYEVTTYDNGAPKITVGDISNNNDNREYKYLNDVIATDNGKIKTLMYTDIELTQAEAKEYFKTKGNIVINNKIRLNDTTLKYTI